MMRRLFLSLVTFLLVLYATAQDGLWSPVSKSSLQTYFNGRSAAAPLPTNYELVKLNRSQLVQLQQRAPLVKPGQVSSLSPVRISLPLPVAGQSLSSAFTESPVISNELASELTGFKTYELKDPATNVLMGRLSITAQGVTGLIFTENGSAYISPVGPDYPDVHLVYYVKDIPVTTPILCGAKDLVNGKNGAGNRVSTVLAGDCNLRNYKLAVAATGEYTAWAGGSQVQALIYIGTLVNDITAIYERDAAITFTLVSNNSIIFTDATTDPYPTVGFPNSALLDNNHSTLVANLGSGNFDQGIVLNNGWNGGLAYLAVVCDPTYKGGGAAGLTFGSGSNPTAGPQGPIFTGTVAHEMAHQFSATHTMISNSSSCNGNVTAATAVEPGGGSTIMAYAGSCGADAYQSYSDLYFHGASILQITNYAVNSATCEAGTPLSNSAPTVSVAATSYTIPVSTPFMLSATGADANNSTLYYCWEQMDAGAAMSGTPSATATSGPNFRSYPPVTTNTRVFPRLADIVSGASTPFEVLPSVTRAMNFQIMVRDEATGGGCTAQKTVTVNTDASAGPFTVTSQNTATSWTADGINTAAITWNVAGSNGAPVNCSNVDILFSTDGGVTFPYTLISNTANDGSETITIPNLPTSVGRVMVKANGNIFFNINTAAITITSSCAANGTTFTPASSVTGAAGNSTLDLSLSPVYGSLVTISGTLASTDPTTGLATRLSTGSSCVYYGGNVFQYDTYRFTPSVTGSYSFARSAGTSSVCTFNLYSGNFDPTSPCTNFMNSSTLSTGSVGNNYSATLTAGVYYTMAVGTFSNNNPTLPANYTINVSGPGSLYSNTPNPGAGFNYTYVIVDNATGLIKAIDPNSDLSNATNYPVGHNYTVYGLSYSNAVSVATLNSYAGSSFTSFQNVLLYSPGTLCGSVSANNVLVTVTATLAMEAAQLLPLSAFKNGNTVNLKWANSSSKNTSYFEIWRSTDGNSFNELVGTVSARDNGSARVDYELNDNAPHSNWNYYRVKQYDINGNATLGNIASVNMQQENTTLSVYPNPVKSALTLAYTSTSIETVDVRVLSSTGSVVYQNVYSAQTGTNRYTISAGSLPKGVYVIQLVSSAGSYTSRFVKE